MTEIRPQRYLVLGGSGFLGSHIVEALVARGEKDVFVFDIGKPLEGDEFEGVTYIQGTILDEEAVGGILREQRITTVFHTISPPHTSKRQTLLDVNVVGTWSLLKTVKTTETVEVLVYTSTTNVVWHGQVVQGGVEDDMELISLRNTYMRSDAYGLSKALAEGHVLKANDPERSFRTVAIRPCGMCGPRERGSMMSKIAEALDTGKDIYEVAGGTILTDTTYVGNVADAHILAADKLWVDSPLRDNIAGHAFSIADDLPHPSNHCAEIAWVLMGADPQRRRFKIPILILWLFAAISEFIALFTGKPPLFSMHAYRYMTTTQYYSCEKAKALLGYKPRVGIEEGCKRMVEWWKEKGEKEWRAGRNK